jgi:transposase InsO family protein
LVNLLFFKRYSRGNYCYNKSGIYTIDFNQYGIKAVNTSPYAPNMNSFTERVIGTIRREALDHFLMFSKKQVQNIIREFVDYYNNHRIHQGINDIPNGFTTSKFGTIKKKEDIRRYSPSLL